MSDENGEHIIGQWSKGYPFCKVAKNLAELCLCSTVLWENLQAMKIVYLVEETSKQSIEEVA